MTNLSETIKTADWKTEKHVPVIECSGKVKADELFTVKVTLGKEIAHPNTTEHHIRWIQLYFLPGGAKIPFQVANAEFTAHGESVDGPNKGPVFTNHEASISMKTGASGTLIALAYCNIHGLWQSAKELAVV
ncbi:MAG: class II SORL domain-containing protein [Kiritimatiellia bacterium]